MSISLPEIEWVLSKPCTQHCREPTHAYAPRWGCGEPPPASSGTGRPGLVWVKPGEQGWLPP